MAERSAAAKLAALAFALCAIWLLGWNALPWALSHLPWSAPLVVVLGVALLSFIWATMDVLARRPGDEER